MNTKDQAIAPKNEGHGHVLARPDGVKARCGGPRVCKVCMQEQAQLCVQSAQPPAPDCRTCVNASVCHFHFNAPVCTNGDKYKPAPAAVLWRTV